MTLEEIAKLPVMQTKAIAEAVSNNQKAGGYIVNCLLRFMAGDFGTVPAEDAAANLAELESGEGHLLGRYKKAEGLDDDIYINAYFSEELRDDIDANHIMLLFAEEW